MTPDSPLHRSLAAWREAERRLAKADAADPTRLALQADVDRLRATYQELFEAVEGVAGHGALYADDATEGLREGIG
jgi:hypothetical protein